MSIWLATTTMPAIWGSVGPLAVCACSPADALKAIRATPAVRSKQFMFFLLYEGAFSSYLDTRERMWRIGRIPASFMGECTGLCAAPGVCWDAMTAAELRDFAVRYTEAWCSQHPALVAEFFSENGSLTING